ncbi:hypothetical protein [Burkholderia cepacia]|uniref:hypothetical protein n=1 Tax=Burkholderia cepacia TaxID=292 RepID=UPI001CF0F00E|nr:hypothetical protein [Burkholderia cepacia]MCA8075351.1 hypothetical protein [Burkholderia cepacia]
MKTTDKSADALPPMPSNVAHVMRRIRRCETEAAAQVVLEHFAIQYATSALALRPVEQHEAAPADQEQRAILEWCLNYHARRVGEGSYHLRIAQTLGAMLAETPSAPLEGTGNGADEQFERFVPLHELSADAAALCHRVQQGSLSPDDLAAHIRTKIDAGLANARAPRTEVAGAAPDWRELSRRLYVELFHCDQQMRSTRDEDGEPHWTQSTVVRDVLADAKTALAAAPQPPSADAAAAPADAQAVEAVTFEITEQAAAEWAARHDVEHVLKHFSNQRNAIEDARTLHLVAAPPPPAPASAPVGLTERQRMDLLLVADDMAVTGDAKLADALRALLSSLGGDRS